MGKVKIVFYPNEGKRSSKTNQVPVYLRISKDKQKIERKLDVYLTDDELLRWNPISQRLEIKDTIKNKVINDIAYEFSGLEYTVRERFKDLSLHEVKDKILGLNHNEPTENTVLIKYLDEYPIGLVQMNKLSIGTIINYRKSIKHLKNYLNYIKQPRILISQFGAKQAMDFNDYLMKTIPSINKYGMSPVSAASIIIKIKTIFKRASDSELIRKNPFIGIKLDTKSPKKEELNINEVKSLIELDLSKEPTLEVYRDIFLFGIYTGLAYSDILDLKKGHILKERDSNMLLKKIRVKTKNDIKQVLIDRAVCLIDKYSTHYEVECTDRIFPYRHLNNINKQLKLIQAKAGIKKNLSTHISRHTCSQFLQELGTIRIDIINDMMGWSNSKLGTNLIYYKPKIDVYINAKSEYQELLKSI